MVTRTKATKAPAKRGAAKAATASKATTAKRATKRAAKPASTATKKKRAPASRTSTAKPPVAAKARTQPRAAARSADKGTRTSSRSAKRRSPKPSGEDAELLEFERLQFLKAMDAYKRRTEQTFPSWSEVLDVIRSIGWMSPARMSTVKRPTGPLV